MPSTSRSHSPPLPPNATYNHPIITLNILPSSKLYLAGSKLTGMLEVSCKEQNKVALGQLGIEFLGVEELKLLDHSARSFVHGPHKCLFQGPALPPSNAVVSSEAPINGHYYTALRGRTKFPFSFPLPSSLPSSIDFENKAKLAYTLKATCQVLNIKSRQNVLVTHTRPVQIIEKLTDWNNPRNHELVEMRGELREPGGGGAGVWAEVKIDKMLHWTEDFSTDGDFLRAKLTVKNSSGRNLSGGIRAKLCRRLNLVHGKSANASAQSPVQVVRNHLFRGPQYEFPAIAGQPKSVDLMCQLPSTSSDESREQVETPSLCFSAKGMKLFSVDMFFRVELELGALTNDLVIDLPLYVAHPASIPKEGRRTKAPTSIEHLPSPDPLSLRHLTQPNHSVQTSWTGSRSSSPHPPSLQPGGGGSRCSSPQPSHGPCADWGGNRSCAPSPTPTPHFSPLPTPRQSPLPSPRFSSPLPISSQIPPHSLAQAIPPPPSVHFPSAPNRSNPLSPYAPERMSTPQGVPSFTLPDEFPPIPPGPHAWLPVHPPYPPQYMPQLVSQDSAHSVQYQTSNHLFSPPSTPWRRQTIGASPDPLTDTPDPRAYGVTPGIPPNSHHAHAQYFSAHRVPPNSMGQYPPPALSPSPNEPNPLSHPGHITPSAHQWRARHQSLPPAPMNHPPINSPLPQPQYIQQTPVPTQPNHRQSVQKRALPTPPSAGNQNVQTQDVTSTSGNATDEHPSARAPIHHHSQPETFVNEDPGHDYRAPSVRPDGLSHHHRLDTIGEIGESRVGTLTGAQLPQEVLKTLSHDNDSDDESPEDRPRQPWRSVRVVSHPRGMRPRRSDGSESVQTLEDLVASSDEIAVSSRESYPEQQGITTALDDCESTDSRLGDSSGLAQSQGERGSSSPKQAAGRASSVDSSYPSTSRYQAQSTGLANLAQFLNRPATSNSGPTSSGHHSKPGSILSVCSSDQEGVQSEKSVGQPATPNYIGATSALRMKSSNIAFDKAFVDAVPSPSIVAEQKLGTIPLGQVEVKSSWQPPSHGPQRKSYCEEIQLDVDHEDEDAGRPRVALVRESVAPDALFFKTESTSIDDDLKHVGRIASSSLFQAADIEQSEFQEKTEQAYQTASAPQPVASEALLPQLQLGQPQSCTLTNLNDSAPVTSPVPQSSVRSVTPLITTNAKLVKKKTKRVEEDSAQEVQRVIPIPQEPTQTVAAFPNITSQAAHVPSGPGVSLVERLRMQALMNKPAEVTNDFSRKLDDSKVVRPIARVPHPSAHTRTCSGLGIELEEAEVKVEKGDLPNSEPQQPVTRMSISTNSMTLRDHAPTKVLADKSLEPCEATHSSTKHMSTEPKATGRSLPLPPQQRAQNSSHALTSLAKVPISLNSIPTRPLPSFIDRARNSAFEAQTRPASLITRPHSVSQYDPSVPTRALCTSKKPRESKPETVSRNDISTRLPSSNTAISSPPRLLQKLSPAHHRPVSPGLHGLDVDEKEPHTQSSPTNLARKSRTKRQVSSTITAEEMMDLSFHRRSFDSSALVDRPSGVVISQIPGGWNEKESNEIEAELIKALRETNMAVHKATSKRLSTPIFGKSPSFNTSTVLSNLLIKNSHYSSSSDILRASMFGSKKVTHEDEQSDKRRSCHEREALDRLTKGGERIGSNSKVGHDSQIGEDQEQIQREYDEDMPIPLTKTEMKSMRGGRGGRVSSVAAQWAKMSTKEQIKAGIRSFDTSDNGVEERLMRNNSRPISNRALSIKDKEHGASNSSYSITSFLGRTTSNRSNQLSSTEGYLNDRSFGKAYDNNRHGSTSLEETQGLDLRGTSKQLNRFSLIDKLLIGQLDDGDPKGSCHINRTSLCGDSSSASLVDQSKSSSVLVGSSRNRFTDLKKRWEK